MLGPRSFSPPSSLVVARPSARPQVPSHSRPRCRVAARAPWRGLSGRRLTAFPLAPVLQGRARMSYAEKPDEITKDEWMEKLNNLHVQRADMNRLIMNYLVTGDCPGPGSACSRALGLPAELRARCDHVGALPSRGAGRGSRALRPGPRPCLQPTTVALSVQPTSTRSPGQPGACSQAVPPAGRGAARLEEGWARRSAGGRRKGPVAGTQPP